MKGVLLAGGSGTRLYPMTKTISKQLIPVYDKPMVYYPLTTLMLAGIREILVITTPRDQAAFKELLGTGAQWGIALSYAIQERPEGIAHALLVSEPFIRGESFALILGDNIFYGDRLRARLQEIARREEGATIFAYWVRDPERYGVVELNVAGEPLSLEEKPSAPKSPYAVPGLYFYDKRAVAFARSLAPSARGELEISDLSRCYLKENMLHVEVLGRGYAWLDTGTQESLLEASHYIATVQRRQGLRIACPEEIAYRMGYITRRDVESIGKQMEKNEYGHYLLQLARSSPPIFEDSLAEYEKCFL